MVALKRVFLEMDARFLFFQIQMIFKIMEYKYVFIYFQ